MKVSQSIETLQQGTGLKDTNGTDICVGDILSMWYAPGSICKGIVKMENASFWFETTEASPPKCLLGDIDGYGNELTVIGNIHVNPELVGGTE